MQRKLLVLPGNKKRGQRERLREMGDEEESVGEKDKRTLKSIGTKSKSDKEH